jgi:hypothetical protein
MDFKLICSILIDTELPLLAVVDEWIKVRIVSTLEPELEARQTRAIKRATSLLHLNTGFDSKFHSLNCLTATLANPHVLAFGGVNANSDWTSPVQLIFSKGPGRSKGANRLVALQGPIHFCYILIA